MIACVIHGAEELTIENHPEPRPQDGEVLVRLVPEESADPTCTIIMKAEFWISKFVSL